MTQTERDGQKSQTRSASIQVRPGDWIQVSGHRLRVAAVDERTRIARTERLDDSGAVVSSVPCRAEGLIPVPATASTTPWPDPPPDFTDGLARARFNLRVHRVALENAGFATDDLGTIRTHSASENVRAQLPHTAIELPNASPAPVKSRDPPLIHPPPCPRCWSYRTRFSSSDAAERWNLECLHCGKHSRVLRIWLTNGGLITNTANRPFELDWYWRACRKDGHDFWISRDWICGRRWLLQINLFASGFWFIYGSYWTRRGAEAWANRFEGESPRWLAEQSFRANFYIPERFAEVVKQRSSAAR